MFNTGWRPNEEEEGNGWKPKPPDPVRFSPRVMAPLRGKPLPEYNRDRVFNDEYKPPAKANRFKKPKKEPTPPKQQKPKLIMEFALAAPKAPRIAPIIGDDHVESKVKVFWTEDYDRFILITGNRVHNEHKIKKILKDIDEGLNVLELCPIIVVIRGNKLAIVDGQHRFIVAQQIGSPVWYVIGHEFTLPDIAKVNSNTERWKDKDFINCYKAQGNAHYTALQDFMDTWNLPVTTAMILLTSGVINKDAGFKNKQDFCDGKFEVMNLIKATETMERVMLFRGFAGVRQRGFIAAICTIAKSGKIRLEDMAEKFKKYPDDLTVQSNQKEYLAAMELLYSKGKHSREVIY